MPKTKTLHLSFHSLVHPTYFTATFNVDVATQYDAELDPRTVAKLQEAIAHYVTTQRDHVDKQIGMFDEALKATTAHVDKHGLEMSESELRDVEAQRLSLLKRGRKFVHDEQHAVTQQVPHLIAAFWDKRKDDKAAVRSSKYKARAKVAAQISLAVAAQGTAITAAVLGGPIGWGAAIGIGASGLKLLHSTFKSVKALGRTEVDVRSEMAAAVVKVEAEADQARLKEIQGKKDSVWQQIKGAFKDSDIKKLIKLIKSHRLAIVELNHKVDAMTPGINKLLDCQEKLEAAIKHIQAAHLKAQMKQYLKQIQEKTGQMMDVVQHLNTSIHKVQAYNKECVVFVKSLNGTELHRAPTPLAHTGQIVDLIATFGSIASSTSKIISAISPH
jgi:hypothetical protein